ncbi:MAG TPA: hypothetical protein VNW99_03130 [Cytophagaceae bacterium]|nr:hypothetical protein [Cytophagaceae bacterium]
MKNFILFTFSIFLVHTGFGQNIFIGKTVSDVKDAYYTAKKENFFQGKNKGTKESYLVIKVMGINKFSATFDRTGKCYEHSTEIKYKDIPLVKGNIKNMGWSYNEKEEKFFNTIKTIYFQVVKEGQLYYLVCKRVIK